MQEKFLILAAYLVAVNLVTFALFAYDKYCAQQGKWRVSEFTLLMWAAVGGSIGAGAAMEICRHKTLHLKFKFGVPLLLFLHIILIGVFVVNPNNLAEKIIKLLGVIQ